jgi:3-methylfumaryl-CoA hydratase
VRCRYPIYFDEIEDQADLFCSSPYRLTDCLVHGPLTATLLLNLVAAAADQASGKVKKLEYRATSPLTVEQRIRLRGAWEGSDRRKASLWALNEAGTVCMTAKATLF